MTEENPTRSRFSLFRDIGDGVSDAARSVTGQSVARDLSEFTDAYTEVLTGLHAEVQTLKRTVVELSNRPVPLPSTEQAIDTMRSEIVHLDKQTRLYTKVALVAVIASAVGVALAVAL